MGNKNLFPNLVNKVSAPWICIIVEQCSVMRCLLASVFLMTGCMSQQYVEVETAFDARKVAADARGTTIQCTLTYAHSNDVQNNRDTQSRATNFLLNSNTIAVKGERNARLFLLPYEITLNYQDLPLNSTEYHSYKGIMPPWWKCTEITTAGYQSICTIFIKQNVMNDVGVILINYTGNINGPERDRSYSARIEL